LLVLKVNIILNRIKQYHTFGRYYVYIAGLKSIKLPSKIKISGRPKGITKTTIGLLKKKKGLPIAFRTLSAEKKTTNIIKMDSYR